MKNKILVKTMALGLSFAMAFGQPLTVFSQEADPSVAAADMAEKAGNIKTGIEAINNDVASIDNSGLNSSEDYKNINSQITEINGNINESSKDSAEQLEKVKEDYETAVAADNALAQEKYKEILATAEESIAGKNNEANSSIEAILSATNVNGVKSAYSDAVAACDEITRLYNEAISAGQTVDNLYTAALSAADKFNESANAASSTLSEVKTETEELNELAGDALDVTKEKAEIDEINKAVEEYNEAKDTYDNLCIDNVNLNYFDQMIDDVKKGFNPNKPEKDTFNAWGKPEKTDFLLKYYFCCEKRIPIKSIEHASDYCSKNTNGKVYNFTYDVTFEDGTSIKYIVLNVTGESYYYCVVPDDNREEVLYTDSAIMNCKNDSLSGEMAARRDGASDAKIAEAENALKTIEQSDAYMAYSAQKLYENLENNTSSAIGNIVGAQNDINVLFDALGKFDVTNIQQSLDRLAAAKDAAIAMAEQAKLNRDKAIEAINRRNQNNNNSNNNYDNNNDDNNGGNGAGGANASAPQVQNATLATNAATAVRTATRRTNVTVVQNEAEVEDETNAENEVIADAEVPTADSVSADEKDTAAEDETASEVVKIEDEKTALADAAPLTNAEKSAMPWVWGGAAVALGAAGIMIGRRFLKAARVKK